MPLSVCPSGHANESQWRYCIECGVPLHGAGTEAAASPASQESRPATGGPPASSDPLDDVEPPGREYLIALVILLVALAVAVATFAFVLRHHDSALASNRATRTASHQNGGTSTGDPRSAAVAVDRLLVESEGNRSSVQQAVGQIASCADVTAAVQALQVAAADREQLLTKLGGLDLSALPRSMVDDLTGSWLSSLDSDISYARWGQDENQSGCTADDYSDPNYQAAIGTDSQASASKVAFLALWDPLAQTNGLPQWQSSQI
jgi:hypothetical protein